MNFFRRASRSILLKGLGRERAERMIVRFARLLNIDLIRVSYNDAGILNYENLIETGENFLISQVLPVVISDETAILFDVGANVGEVSAAFRRAFPRAEIWAFEPNPITYSQLLETLRNTGIRCERVGLGSQAATRLLHSYSQDLMSGHASLYADVFELYRGYGVIAADQIESFECKLTTIDTFCAEHNIEQIHFLKIDVEGHELEVLKGACATLSAGKIAAIQFEFNDCNVLSRVFLKDFYEILPGYRVFRLNRSGLIPLGAYSAKHEIFQFQNIFALREELEARIGRFRSGRRCHVVSADKKIRFDVDRAKGE